MKFTNARKIETVGYSPEVLSAVKLLYSLKKDVKAKNFILIGYEIEGEYHQLIFRKTKRIKVKKKIKSSKK